MKNLNIINKSKPIILSASRMTDMPKYYPAEMINEVTSRINKGLDIHTLVIWTKHPDSLLNNKLHEFLLYLKSINIGLYLHCTITGMGGVIIGTDTDNRTLSIEPNAPSKKKSLLILKYLIDLLENPMKIRIRIDPIIRIKSISTGDVYSNLIHLEYIVKSCSCLGITDFSISFLENNAHKKVIRRFEKIGWDIIPPDHQERLKTTHWLKQITNKYAVNIYACCVDEMPKSRCIDGYLLENLHPLKKSTNKNEPQSRLLCGCTHSIDIGGWPPKKCFTGCQYCYSNSSYS